MIIGFRLANNRPKVIFDMQTGKKMMFKISVIRSIFGIFEFGVQLRHAINLCFLNSIKVEFHHVINFPFKLMNAV